MTEIWKPIPETECLYEASSLGRLRSTARECFTPLGRRCHEGRVLRPQLTGRRYPVVSISINGKIKTMIVHRLVAMAFIPNPDSLPEVNHIDGNKLNPNPQNLEWCTRVRNNDHAISTGLKPPVQGSKHGNAKLMEEQATLIRDQYARGDISMLKLGKSFGVSAQTICGVVHRQSWAHV